MRPAARASAPKTSLPVELEAFLSEHTPYQRRKAERVQQFGCESAQRCRSAVRTPDSLQPIGMQRLAMRSG